MSTALEEAPVKEKLSEEEDAMLEYMGIAKRTAHKLYYKTAAPGIIDLEDLESEAYVILLKVLKQKQKNTIGNPQAYLSRAIWNGLNKLINKAEKQKLSEQMYLLGVELKVGQAKEVVRNYFLGNSIGEENKAAIEKQSRKNQQLMKKVLLTPEACSKSEYFNSFRAFHLVLRNMQRHAMDAHISSAMARQERQSLRRGWGMNE